MTGPDIDIVTLRACVAELRVQARVTEPPTLTELADRWETEAEAREQHAKEKAEAKRRARNDADPPFGWGV